MDDRNQDMAGRIMAHAFHDELEKISGAVDPSLLLDMAQIANNYAVARSSLPIIRDAVRGALGKAPVRKGSFGTRYHSALNPEVIADDVGRAAFAVTAGPQAVAPIVRDAARGALGKAPIRKGTVSSRYRKAERRDIQRLADFVRKEGR